MVWKNTMQPAHK